jgi:hypothetical protein
MWNFKKWQENRRVSIREVTRDQWEEDKLVSVDNGNKYN